MSEDESLMLPNALHTILIDYDSKADDFDEIEVSFILERQLSECGEISIGQRKTSFAEIAALQMPLVDGQERSKWGTRFGPVVDGIRKDGSRYLFPDIANIDSAIIRYWSRRAAQTKHAVFKARYADIVWDLTKAVTGDKASIEMARQAIDAYIDCATKFSNTDTAENRLERALELALTVGDKKRVESVLATMFKLLDSTEYSSSRLIWLFDLRLRMKGVTLSAEQEEKLIGGLEAELQQICGPDNPAGIVAKEPALRLAGYYEKCGDQDNAKRVIRSYGEALAKFAEKAQGLLAMHWYQELYAVFNKFGLKDEAERFQIAAKNKGEEAKSQMVRHSHSIEIPNDEIEKILEQLTAGDLNEAITKIAFNLFPKLDDLAQQLEDTQQHAKLLSMISFVKMDNNQVVARAGGIEDDREGRLMFQMAENLKFDAIFLGKALDLTRTRYEFVSRTVLQVLFQSPLFDPDRTPLLEQAIDAYLAGDHVKTIHILVPQIEHFLRRLLAMLGKPTNKHRRSDLGVMIEKSLNDILDEPAIQRCLGDDATFYLRVLLCDPRGFNVRNDLAHGLLPVDSFDRFLSDRLMHVLFLLAQLQDKTAS